ncbi:MAG: 4-hydroxy-tetrahydrodipicolinate synthase [Firmicutes bacterium]|nr:4-hydroxy-tetrahydrodipicolinate synthase [Bacillota bacterium]
MTHKVNWGRLITAMATPFKADGSVDYDLAKALARHLVETGSDGLVVAGTTGESPTLSHGEKLRLFEAVAAEVSDRVPVIAGTGSNSTAASVELSKEVEEVGVSGLLLVVPYYNRPSQDGLYRHFRTVAEATSLPILLYNIPSRTGTNMLASTTLRLAADVENIVAVKESAGDLGAVAEICRKAPENFLVYNGDDAMTLPHLAVGGYGVVSVVAHVVGPDMQAMIQAYLAGDVAKAAALHQKLMPVFKGLFITTNPTPLKAALAMVGFPVGGPRLPLVEPTSEELGKIRQSLLESGVKAG